MPNPDRRTKMISLRLSQTEYDVLKRRYRAYGVRNVSDLARLALQRIISVPPDSTDVLDAKLAEINGRISALETHVRTPQPVFGTSPILREGGSQ